MVRQCDKAAGGSAYSEWNFHEMPISYPFFLHAVSDSGLSDSFDTFVKEEMRQIEMMFSRCFLVLVCFRNDNEWYETQLPLTVAFHDLTLPCFILQL